MPKRLILTTLVLSFLLAALAPAEVTQKGHLRVSFEGELTPHILPLTTL